MAQNYSLYCETSCARVCNCLYMYSEKRVFFYISTILQALCWGGGRGLKGGLGMNEWMKCNFTSFLTVFQPYQKNEWLFAMEPR